MLNQLTVRNYAIVEFLEIEFSAGMTAITGETGAGKSIILGALGLALGDRGDRASVRQGARQADITARFDTCDHLRARSWLESHELLSEDEPELCLLRRVVGKDGRSRAWINGFPSTLQQIRSIGEMLIDIHSQHEHQSLLRRSTHLRLLDEFSGKQELAASLRSTARQWRRNRDELDELTERSGELSAQNQLIQYQVDELDELALGEDELEMLEQEYALLNSADSTLASVQSVMGLLNEENPESGQSVAGVLNHALALLQDIRVKSPCLESGSELLGSASVQLEEAINELGRSVDEFEANPERLEEINQRLGQIHQIARKHRVRPEELAAVHAELRQQLEGFTRSDEQLETLTREDARLREVYLKLARELSASRRESSDRLAASINSQLTRLGMENARVEVQLEPQESEALSPGGLEAVEFLVSTNPGQEPRPLNRVASGGELSRISLAIQVVTAQTSRIPTLVFDEVDVGIGGGVARAVGELLRQLGSKGQVLCVTHQAQVAGQAHHHLFVSKASAGDGVETRISALDQDEKVREIARMLGGEKSGGSDFSERSLAHAQEMLR